MTRPGACRADAALLMGVRLHWGVLPLRPSSAVRTESALKYCAQCPRGPLTRAAGHKTFQLSLLLIWSQFSGKAPQRLQT